MVGSRRASSSSAENGPERPRKWSAWSTHESGATRSPRGRATRIRSLRPSDTSSANGTVAAVLEPGARANRTRASIRALSASDGAVYATAVAVAVGVGIDVATGVSSAMDGAGDAAGEVVGGGGSTRAVQADRASVTTSAIGSGLTPRIMARPHG